MVSYWQKYVHEVLVNRLGGLSLPRKSVVRLTDHPDMTLDVYRGRKTTMQQQQQHEEFPQKQQIFSCKKNNLSLQASVLTDYLYHGSSLGESEETTGIKWYMAQEAQAGMSTGYSHVTALLNKITINLHSW